MPAISTIVNVLFNRKSLLVLFYTLYTIMLSAIPLSCTVNKHEFAVPAAKKFVYGGSGGKTLIDNTVFDSTYSYYSLSDFPTQLTDASSPSRPVAYGGMSAFEIQTPGTLTTVLTRNCTPNATTSGMLLVVSLFLFFAPILAALMVLVVTLAHRRIPGDTFAHWIVLEIAQTDNFLRAVIGSIILILTMVMYPLVHVVALGGTGTWLQFLVNIGLTAFSLNGYLVYQGAIQIAQLKNFQHCSPMGLPCPVFRVAMDFNAKKRPSVVTSAQFFNELFSVLSVEEPIFAQVRAECRAFIDEHIEPSDAQKRWIKVVQENYALQHVSLSWLHYYSDEEWQQVRVFFNGARGAAGKKDADEDIYAAAAANTTGVRKYFAMAQMWLQNVRRYRKTLQLHFEAVKGKNTIPNELSSSSSSLLQPLNSPTNAQALDSPLLDVTANDQASAQYHASQPLPYIAPVSGPAASSALQSGDPAQNGLEVDVQNATHPENAAVMHVESQPCVPASRIEGEATEEVVAATPFENAQHFNITVADESQSNEAPVPVVAVASHDPGAQGTCPPPHEENHQEEQTVDKPTIEHQGNGETPS